MKILFVLIICFSASVTFTQTNWQKGGNSVAGVGGPTIGTDNTWNAPFQLITNGTIRMHINPNLGTTAGFVGIGNTNPLSPLHVTGSGTFSSLGWTRAISISNGGTLAFLQMPGANSIFFMGSPSSSPLGDFYFGTNSALGAGGIVKYGFKSYGQNVSPGLGAAGSVEKASTQFFTNTYVMSGDGTKKYFGVNIIEPKMIADFFDAGSGITNSQLRLTFKADNNPTLGTKTDFKADASGLNIVPTDGTTQLPVYIHQGGATLTQNSLIVNGDARLRYAPVDPTSESIMLGKIQGGGPNDIAFRRLEFTGNPNDVLLGNGTWGTLTPPSTGLGAFCSDPPGSGDLPANAKIGLNGFNFYFEGQGTFGNNAVGVGYNCVDLLIAKFNVKSTGTGTPIGILSAVSSTNTDNTSGVFRTTTATSSNTGVNATGTGGLTATAYFGQGTNASTVNYGINALGSSGNPTTSSSVYAFGGYFKGSYANSSFGIYAEAVPSVSGTTTLVAGYFAGSIVTSGAPITPSDIQFKENITEITNGPDVISQLSPVNYTYKTTGNAQYMHFNQGQQVGFIAQDVESIAPDLVSTLTHPAQYDSVGSEIVPAFDYKTLNYEKFIPYLVADAQNKNEIIEQQDSIITDLNDRLTNLENCLSNILPYLCDINSSMIMENSDQTQQQLKNTMDVHLQNGNSIILNQNVPNPFAEQTVISYSIPESVKMAQILFYDQTGKLINAIDLNQRGLGQINVFGSDLSTGIYTYTLVADGVIVTTKKMMKTN